MAGESVLIHFIKGGQTYLGVRSMLVATDVYI